jgi:cytochrome b561
MRAALAHTLMLVFAAVVARTGWFMAHAPERALRFFTLGTDPVFGKTFGATWCRTLGWIFTWFFGIGVVFYLILIPIDIFHSR